MQTIHDRVSASKEIKKTLSNKWSSIQWSVVSNSFANGNSIDVYWNLGPTQRQVESIVKKYEYGRFDSMTDYSYTESTYVMTEANEVKTLGGAKFVMCHRTEKPYSLREQFCRDLCALQRMPYIDENSPVFPNSNQRVSEYFWRVFCATDFTDAIYDGVEYDETIGRNEFVKIKLRPITTEERAENELKAQEACAMKTKERTEKASKSQARKNEIKASFIKLMTDNPTGRFWSSSYRNWTDAQIAGRVLRELQEEGFAKIAYISGSGKKIYTKAGE